MFAVGQVDQPYKLYEGYPRMEIKPSTDILDDIPISSGCLICVEYVEDPTFNLFDIFQVSVINHCLLYCVGISIGRDSAYNHYSTVE